MFATRNVTRFRFRLNPMYVLGAAAMASGFLSGLLTGVSAMMFTAPSAPAYAAPEVCELVPPSDPIGFRILMEEARRGPAVHL